MVININIKVLRGNSISASISEDSTVEQLKNILVEESKIPVESQRLIYKGKVLKPDTQLLSHWNIEDGDAVHLIKMNPRRPVSTSSETTTTTETPSTGPSFNVTASVHNVRGSGAHLNDIVQSLLTGTQTQIMNEEEAKNGIEYPSFCFEDLKVCLEEIRDRHFRRDFPATISILDRADDSKSANNSNPALLGEVAVMLAEQMRTITDELERCGRQLQNHATLTNAQERKTLQDTLHNELAPVIRRLSPTMTTIGRSLMSVQFDEEGKINLNHEVPPIQTPVGLGSVAITVSSEANIGMFENLARSAAQSLRNRASGNNNNNNNNDSSSNNASNNVNNVQQTESNETNEADNVQVQSESDNDEIDVEMTSSNTIDENMEIEDDDENEHDNDAQQNNDNNANPLASMMQALGPMLNQSNSSNNDNANNSNSNPLAGMMQALGPMLNQSQGNNSNNTANPLAGMMQALGPMLNQSQGNNNNNNSNANPLAGMMQALGPMLGSLSNNNNNANTVPGIPVPNSTNIPTAELATTETEVQPEEEEEESFSNYVFNTLGMGNCMGLLMGNVAQIQNMQIPFQNIINHYYHQNINKHEEKSITNDVEQYKLMTRLFTDKIIDNLDLSQVEDKLSINTTEFYTRIKKSLHKNIYKLIQLIYSSNNSNFGIEFKKQGKLTIGELLATLSSCFINGIQDVQQIFSLYFNKILNTMDLGPMAAMISPMAGTMIIKLYEEYQHNLANDDENWLHLLNTDQERKLWMATINIDIKQQKDQIKRDQDRLYDWLVKHNCQDINISSDQIMSIIFKLNIIHIVTTIKVVVLLKLRLMKINIYLQIFY